MATFLDLALLGQIRGAFTLLLTWVVVFGMLEMTKPFGDGKKGLHSIIAVALAFLVLISGPARAMIDYMLPWFAVLAIGGFFLIFVLSVVSGDSKVVFDSFGKQGRTWFTILIVILAVFALGAALRQNDPVPQQQLPNGTYDYAESGLSGPGPGAQQMPPPNKPQTFGEEVVMIFTHPKFLGLLFLLLLGTFTITFLSRSQ